MSTLLECERSFGLDREDPPSYDTGYKGQIPQTPPEAVDLSVSCVSRDDYGMTRYLRDSLGLDPTYICVRSRDNSDRVLLFIINAR